MSVVICLCGALYCSFFSVWWLCWDFEFNCIESLDQSNLNDIDGLTIPHFPDRLRPSKRLISYQVVCQPIISFARVHKQPIYITRLQWAGP